MKAILLIILSALVAFPGFGFGKNKKIDFGKAKDLSSPVDQPYANGSELTSPSGKENAKGNGLFSSGGRIHAEGSGLFSPGGRTDAEGNGLFSSADNPDGDGQGWFSPIAKPYAEGKELLALVDTEEEARQIAEIYEIEFVQFANGVATYHTEEAPGAVVERGRENGWPEISVNYIRKAF